MQAHNKTFQQIQKSHTNYLVMCLQNKEKKIINNYAIENCLQAFNIQMFCLFLMMMMMMMI
jgi:hypothetical protein